MSYLGLEVENVSDNADESEADTGNLNPLLGPAALISVIKK
jgi:hypothetical protein